MAKQASAPTSEEARNQRGFREVAPFHLSLVFTIDHGAITPEHESRCVLNLDGILSDRWPNFKYHRFDVEFGASGGLSLKALDFDADLLEEIRSGHIKVEAITERIEEARRLEPKDEALAEQLGFWALRCKQYNHVFDCRYVWGSEHCHHAYLPDELMLQHFLGFAHLFKSAVFPLPLKEDDVKELFEALRSHSKLLGMDYHRINTAASLELKPEQLLPCFVPDLNINQVQAFLVAFLTYLRNYKMPIQQHPAVELATAIVDSGM